MKVKMNIFHQIMLSFLSMQCKNMWGPVALLRTGRASSIVFSKVSCPHTSLPHWLWKEEEKPNPLKKKKDIKQNKYTNFKVEDLGY